MSKTKMKNSIAGDIFMKPPSSSSILSHFLVFALTCCSFNATLMVEELRGEMMIVVGFLHRLIIPQHVQPMETIDSSLRIFMAQAPWASPPCSSAAAAAHNKGCISPYLLALLGLVVFFTILYSEDVSVILGTQFDAFSSSSSTSDDEKPAFVVAEAEAEAESGGCDLFKGRWVWDDDHRPMYEESDCPYIPPQLTCQKHGRPDKDYQHWRWQPHACSIPSFNATLMLESLRNKRMMFVGDSLNRGQLVSLACLLHRTIPEDAKYANITYDFMSLFKAKDYNATFEFYWAPYLLASSSDNGIRHTIRNKQFVLEGSINWHGQNWKGVDILVFNTYMWWIKKPIVNMLKETSGDKEKTKIMEVPREEAYLMALQSMVQWVEENMDPNNTRVFFTTMSPMHERSINWGGDAKGNCYNETTMIEDPNYWSPDFLINLMNVTNEVLRKSKYPITFLNITHLSGYRKDAHTSIYKKQWGPLTPEQLANPASYADCTHWCLPGLQDTWNELLFAKLFYP